jgi:hypothetical protein
MIDLWAIPVLSWEMTRLTSVRHSPGVVIKNPSLPCLLSTAGSWWQVLCTYIVRVWPNCRFRAEVELYLLRDDFLADLNVRYEPTVHFVGRHLGNVFGGEARERQRPETRK